MDGELKTKTPSVGSLKFRERTLTCTKCKRSERLWAKSKDFTLMSCIDGSSYISGGNKKLRKRVKKCKIEILYFECIGGYEGVTGRRKLRCREPSRISSRVRIGMQKK